MKTTLSVHEKQYVFCPTCRAKLKRKLVEKRYLSSCPRCNFIFWNNPKPTVSVLLHKGKKILLIQKTNKPLRNCWCLPGGYINYEESLREAICRETKEEIFKLLAGRYKPENIMSVGDQYQTDIEPAQKMGMRTLQVKTPKDLEQLLNILQ